MARPGTPNRGYDILLQVIEGVRKYRPDLQLTLFGSRELPGLPRNLPLVHLGVEQNLENLARHYSAADVFVDTSRFQGFGRCGLEAMACGTACVLGAEGGVREYASPGENCLMVESGDVGGYVRAALQLLEDNELRLRLVEAGLATAERFSLDLEAHRTDELFADLVQ